MHGGIEHHHHHGHSFIRVQVVLNTGDHSISDSFRLSYTTNWDNFFSRVKLALCPELVPEPTDCMRDRSGAHVFDVDVLTNGEVLYFCPRGEKLRSTPHGQAGLQPMPMTQPNFIQAATAFAGGNAGFGHPDLRASNGPFGLQPGMDFQQALGSLPSHSLTLSFPDPDGAQPLILPETTGMLDSSAAIYFPSPVPPDEEPPYIPEQHEGRAEKEEGKGDVGHAGGGNAGANVGGNTGVSDNHDHKPEGELEEKVKKEEGGKEKENEKEEVKQ